MTASSFTSKRKTNQEQHIKPQSCKAKGRKLQKKVAADLLEIGKQYGLEPDDCVSRGMGQNGVDVVLSPAARRLFPLYIECKNVEKLNVVQTFNAHFEKYAADEKLLKLLVHSKNNHKPLVTLRWEDFLEVFSQLIVLSAAQVQKEVPVTRAIGFASKPNNETPR